MNDKAIKNSLFFNIIIDQAINRVGFFAKLLLFLMAICFFDICSAAQAKEVACHSVSTPDISIYKDGTPVNYQNQFHLYIPAQVEQITLANSIMRVTTDIGSVDISHFDMAHSVETVKADSELDFNNVFYGLLCDRGGQIEDLKKKYPTISEWVKVIKGDAFSINVIDNDKLRVFIIGERSTKFKYALVFDFENFHHYGVVRTTFNSKDKMINLFKSIHAKDYLELVK